MKGINILRGIADLLVQVLMLAIYVPKTLYRILVDPEWVPQFIVEESSKEETSEEYVSPVFLYILTVMVPYALVPLHLLEFARNKDAHISQIVQDPATLVRAATFICIPLIFAFFTELFKSTSFSRSALEQSLFTQCYYFAPLVFMVQLRWVFEVNKYSFGGYHLHYFLIPLLVITVVWLLLVQINFLSKRLERDTKKIISVLLLSTMLIFMITDSIGFKIVKGFGFPSEWLGYGIIIVFLVAITALYLVAFIKKCISILPTIQKWLK